VIIVRDESDEEEEVSNPEYVSIADLFEALAKKVPNLPPEDILVLSYYNPAGDLAPSWLELQRGQQYSHTRDLKP
jgi:hypothetical protein